ncbi:SGNH/GDSL hydrolase family protein [Candidatus Mycobacterium wuenschmannii]|uniref:SGNH/GDSL hydrolase family protein n=1 Tax=Candidatus Mycobacterium wuenschmannii TaxID=3027808 RepID=A0ABY8W0D0_9MYCO|nr:SGNH/GDSL hydrolase family protein [Candidatus Mycobacterium wuenschmannii]WIM87219.1 SGNH/GDSL hydrolase family protein [Candidatus Mycobacterium wuenschmannii]
MTRYVALGSSMAAGPGIKPSAPGAPFGSGRSARNYAHLVAEQLGFDLVDVTFSGATTANVLAERQRGAPPQIEALNGAEGLVTVTIGGNDVGYVPLLMAASLPALARKLPSIRELLDRGARESALDGIGDALRAVGTAVRHRAPRARVLFVDYLTLLPAPGFTAAPLSAEHADLGRFVANRLEEATAAAAADTGCEVVRAGQASREHHGWSPTPWVRAAGWPVPWRPAPFHPNGAGMRAVAELIREQVRAA